MEKILEKNEKKNLHVRDVAISTKSTEKPF